MNTILTKDKDYSAWLKELKTKVRLVQIKAAVEVNSELLWFYWEFGQDIIHKQKNSVSPLDVVLITFLNQSVFA
jgi:hypothetical protein